MKLPRVSFLETPIERAVFLLITVPAIAFGVWFLRSYRSPEPEAVTIMNATIKLTDQTIYPMRGDFVQSVSRELSEDGMNVASEPKELPLKSRLDGVYLVNGIDTLRIELLEPIIGSQRRGKIGTRSLGFFNGYALRGYEETHRLTLISKDDPGYADAKHRFENPQTPKGSAITMAK